MGVGARAAAGGEGEREREAPGGRLFGSGLSKRQELRETGTEARQLRPSGGLGLPTTSPCFSEPYVQPLPDPTPPS